MASIETNLKRIEDLIRAKLVEYSDSSLTEEKLLELLLTAGEFESKIDSEIRGSKARLYYYATRESLVKYIRKNLFQEADVKSWIPSSLTSLQVAGEPLLDLNEKDGQFAVEIYTTSKTHQIALPSVLVEEHSTKYFDIEPQNPENAFLFFENLLQVTKFIEEELPAFEKVPPKKFWGLKKR